MSDCVDLNLSGAWAGAFSYARSLTTITFEARLEDVAGALAGYVEERSRLQPSLRLNAMLGGRRSGLNVTWIKRYPSSAPSSYRFPVAYAGALSRDGVEISGAWTILGLASGTFLMVRAKGVEAAIERETETVAR